MKYKIGDVERILGISAETLRYFEKKGVIIPQKNETNNYRYFDTLDINKLVAYKFYRSMEFSMDESVEMLNAMTHLECIEQIDLRIGAVQQKIKYYETLLMRMKDLKYSFEQIDEMENNFRIEYSPEILLYYNQVNDKFETRDGRRETTRKWLSQLPFVSLALHIPREEVPSGELVHWGYALRTEYQEVAAQMELLLTRKIPSRRSVYTVLKCREGKVITPQSLQSALDFMRERGLVLSGDVIGDIIYEERDDIGIIRYFEVWLPISDEVTNRIGY